MKKLILHQLAYCYKKIDVSSIRQIKYHNAAVWCSKVSHETVSTANEYLYFKFNEIDHVCFRYQGREPGKDLFTDQYKREFTKLLE